MPLLPSCHLQEAERTSDIEWQLHAQPGKTCIIEMSSLDLRVNVLGYKSLPLVLAKPQNLTTTLLKNNQLWDMDCSSLRVSAWASLGSISRKGDDSSRDHSTENLLHTEVSVLVWRGCGQRWHKSSSTSFVFLILLTKRRPIRYWTLESTTLALSNDKWS